MKVLGTGLSGLVGSRVAELLSDHIDFENLSLESGIDITDPSNIESCIARRRADWVFHFAAYTDVDGAQKEKKLGKHSPVWKINVTATEDIVRVCRASGKRMLYVSTDFIFDGKKDTYSEEDVPCPLNWYAQTKYEGEKRVLSLKEKSLIVRIAFPYKAINSTKPDFVHRIITKLMHGEAVSSPRDYIFTPTFIDDIAFAVDHLVSIGASGIYHVVGSQSVSSYQAARLIAEVFKFDTSKILPIPAGAFFAGRAPRPYHVSMKNDKIKALGVSMSTFAEGLDIMKSQQTKIFPESRNI